LSNLKVIYRLFNLLMHVLTNGISDFNIFAVDNKLHIQLTIIQTFLGEMESYVKLSLSKETIVNWLC